ncbi:MAG: hypothetical protein R3Y62_01765 [Eubacteriales bacterium]
MNKEEWKKIWSKLGKFRYPLLILLVGIVLMLLPTKEEETEVVAEPTPSIALDTLAQTEAQLEALLSNADGVGTVQVMLQYATSDKIIYQLDVTQELDTAMDSTYSRTAEETALNGNEPMVVQTIYPTYSGAVVVAEGGDNPTVKLNLVKAVSSLTGLGADAITVIKMKDN